MSKHTPGKWYIVPALTASENHKGWMIMGERVAIALNVNPINDANGDPTEEGKANAALIAAAPDLLEACKYVVQYHREHDSGEGELFGLDFVTTCINAIRKAEGRTIPAQPTNAD